MDNKAKLITLVLFVAGFSVLFCFPATRVSSAADASTTFTESFATTSYRDAGNTSAAGWGTGLIMLPDQPATASHISGVTTNQTHYEVDVSGNYAYVAVYSKIEVYNIANPGSMVNIVNVSRAGMNAYAVYVHGNYLYVAGGAGGMFVFNITNPASPTYVNSAYNGGTYLDVKVSGTTAYCSAYSGGLKVYDVTNLASITMPSSHLDGSDYYGLSIAGNYLYQTQLGAGLAIYNLTANPKAPAYITKLYLADMAKDVQVVGSYAYVACDLTGMHVVDVTNPAAPVNVGYYDFPRAYDIQVVGNYAFLACEDSSMSTTYMGLVVLDVSTPTAPTYKGTYSISGEPARGLVVSGNYTYVCNAYRFDCFNVTSLVNNLRIPNAWAQSLEIASRSPPSVFVSINITLIFTMPASTQINLFASADAGSHWEAVTAGTQHLFTSTGTSLRWRMVLTTSDLEATPIIDTLNATYTYTVPDPPAAPPATPGYEAALVAAFSLVATVAVYACTKSKMKALE